MFSSPLVLLGTIFAAIGAIFLVVGLAFAGSGISKYRYAENLRASYSPELAEVFSVTNSNITINSVALQNILIDVNGQRAEIKGVHPKNVALNQESMSSNRLWVILEHFTIRLIRKMLTSSL